MILSESKFFKNQQYIDQKKINNNRTNSYAFSFVSLISPFSLKQNTLILNNMTLKSRKIVVKQSYILVSWMSYLTSTSTLTTKAGNYGKSRNKKLNSSPSFFVQPVRIFKTTTLKSPMAHKTFSQEQFIFKFFKLSVSFKFLNTNNLQIPTLNQSLHLFLTFRQNPFSPSTNLFFLKKYTLTLVIKDTNFFKKSLVSIN